MQSFSYRDGFFIVNSSPTHPWQGFEAQRKIPVVFHFQHHRHKACIASDKHMVRWTFAASGSPLAQLAQLALSSWLAYLPAPVPCTMQKIFSSRKKWSYDQNIRLFFDPDSVNHAKLHIFDSFREFQSKNRRVFWLKMLWHVALLPIHPKNSLE